MLIFKWLLQNNKLWTSIIRKEGEAVRIQHPLATVTPRPDQLHVPYPSPLTPQVRKYICKEVEVIDGLIRPTV